MHAALQVAVAALQLRRVDAIGERHAEEVEMVAGEVSGHGGRSPRRKRGGVRREGLAPASAGASRQTLKDSPQPQRSFSLGLLNLKPSLRPSFTKSSSVPSR